MTIKYSVLNANPTAFTGVQATSSAAGAPGGINQAPTASGIQQRVMALANAAKAGDPAAIAQLQQLTQPGVPETNDPMANEARKLSNSLLGTSLKVRWDDTSVLHDLAPGLLAAGGALGAGLLAPVLGAGGIAAAPAFPAAAATAPAAASTLAGAGGLLGTVATAAPVAAGAAGVAKAAKGLLGTGLSAKDVIGGGLGLLGTIDAANQGAEADRLRKQALDFATNDYNQRAPARTLAMQKVLAPVRNVQNRQNPFTMGG